MLRANGGNRFIWSITAKAAYTIEISRNHCLTNSRGQQQVGKISSATVGERCLKKNNSTAQEINSWAEVICSRNYTGWICIVCSLMRIPRRVSIACKTGNGRRNDKEEGKKFQLNNLFYGIRSEFSIVCIDSKVVKCVRP